MQNDTNGTIIGFFSEAWDSQRALEDLKYAGFGDRLRYIENDNITHADDTKQNAGVTRFFAKVYGFDDEDGYLDSRGNWTVSPEAEEYFTDIYYRKNHVILVQGGNESKNVAEIIERHHGRVERQNYAFFYSVNADRNRSIPDGPHNIPPHYHPTTAVEPPFESL